VLDARNRLLESVDEQVVRQLKTRDGEIRQSLSEFDLSLLLIAKAELPDAIFHADDKRRFDYQGQTFTTEWPLADDRGWQFFRLTEGTLAPQLIEGAKARAYNAAGHLRFDLTAYPGRMGDVELLKGTTGWARVAKLRLVTPALTREHLVISVLPDNGQDVHPDTIERLMAVPATIADADGPVPEQDLATIETRRRQELFDQAEQQNAAWLDDESEKLDAYAEDLEKSFETELKGVEAEIKAAKKALRGSSLPMAEKLAEKRRVSVMEGRRDKLKSDFFERRAAFRVEVESMLDRIQESLKLVPTMTPLFTIRWEVE
jgi:hypothetical protein